MSERQDKLNLRSRVNERYHDQIFEEMKKLEEKKSEEALHMVQKKHDLWRYQNERDEARRLQRSGNSRRVKKENNLGRIQRRDARLRERSKERGSGRSGRTELRAECDQCSAKDHISLR